MSAASQPLCSAATERLIGRRQLQCGRPAGLEGAVLETNLLRHRARLRQREITYTIGGVCRSANSWLSASASRERTVRSSRAASMRSWRSTAGNASRSSSAEDSRLSNTASKYRGSGWLAELRDYDIPDTKR